jgi:DTW domain-containing protein YfiP
MSDCKSDAEIRAELSKLLKESDPKNRESLVAESIVHTTSLKFDTVKCRRCWLSISECICSDATQVSTFQHNFVVIMHAQEFGSGSNTGGLLQVSMPPQNVKVLVRGIPEQDAEIAEICSKPNTFALFPKQGAIPFAEYDSLTKLSQTASPEIRYNIIIVDGTWTQAKKVLRSLPLTLPCVCLSSFKDLSEDLKRPMRAHIDPSRVCTLGAIILLLGDMGCDPSVMQSLSKLLALKTAVICRGKKHSRTDE